MMAGMLAESERQMRAYVDDAIGRAADQAAKQAVNEAMREFKVLVFGRPDPTPEDIARMHQMQSAHKLLVRGVFVLAVFIGSWLFLDRMIERGDQLADALRDRSSIERPVIGRTP